MPPRDNRIFRSDAKSPTSPAFSTTCSLVAEQFPSRQVTAGYALLRGVSDSLGDRDGLAAPYVPRVGLRPGAPLRAVSCLARRPALQSTMLDWARCDAVERASDRLSGAWTFKGTRVPVKALFENLEDGATVEQFLQWFPGVTRGQVEAVLEHTAQSLTEV